LLISALSSVAFAWGVEETEKEVEAVGQGFVRTLAKGKVSDRVMLYPSAMAVIQ